MVVNRSWTIRRTAEREALVDRLRDQLKNSGREVETLYGVVTTSAIFDEALKELERVLQTEGRRSKAAGKG